MKDIARRGGHHRPGRRRSAQAAGQAFYNTSNFTLRDLQVPRQPAAAQGRLRGLPRRLLAERPGHPRQLRVPQPDPAPLQGRRARHADREVPRPGHQPQPEPGAERRRLGEAPGLDNHAMGTVFEELVRRFNEENNEEAGEHWTPRDAVQADGEPDLPADRRPRSSPAPTCSTTAPAAPAAC